MPPLFSLGYHQCRWNYMTQDETTDVSSNMTKHNIPCDAVWLDIEYSDKKKYFTWNKVAFPEARQMLDKIIKDGRKLVTIIDPHIRNDEEYWMYQDIVEQKLYITDSTRQDPYVG